VPVLIHAANDDVVLDQIAATTDPDGLADFSGLIIRAKAGEIQLVASAGALVSPPYSVRLAAGPPARLLVLTPPPRRFKPDTAFSTAPVIEVQDAAGNPLADVPVQITVTFDKVLARYSKAMEQKRTKEKHKFPDPQVFGPTIRTGNDGQGTLSGIGITAREGLYRLTIGAGTGLTETFLIEYDADQAYRRNFIEIGAIRTLAGTKPDDEFFALRTRFRLNRRFMATVESDVALSNRESSDSAGSSQRRLSEAFAAIEWKFHSAEYDATSIPERELAVGIFGQVFNTVPYAGVRVSAVELRNSLLEGSAMSLGFAAALYSTPIVVDGDAIRPRPANMFINTYVRSSTVDFFKVLTLRGSFLLPFGRGSPLTSRIAVIVPIQTIKWW
jgi:hypothetical protein